MLNKEYTILEPFTRAPWKKLTFREVKALSKNSSTHYVHASLKRFVEEDILKEEKVGSVIVYSMANTIFAANTFGYAVEFKAQHARHLPHNNIQKLINRIKTPFYCFIVTGSYARNRQKKSSDLDVVIICDKRQKPNALLSQIKLEAELMTPQVHPYIFTATQFHEMLTNDEENYGKEIARNNLIITGGKQFYMLLMEAIHHGFNG